jgi:hypothetical protein
MMTAEIFKERSWIYERLVYPISLIFASVVSSVLLQASAPKVYLWGLLTTSAGYTVLTFAKFDRYTKN